MSYGWYTYTRVAGEGMARYHVLSKDEEMDCAAGLPYSFIRWIDIVQCDYCESREWPEHPDRRTIGLG